MMATIYVQKQMVRGISHFHLASLLALWTITRRRGHVMKIRQFVVFIVSLRCQHLREAP
jgi:hypothetical protein